MSPEALAAHRRESVRQLMAEREAAAQERLERAVGRCGIPERFRGKSFEQFQAVTPKQQRILRACRTYAERVAADRSQGANLLLLGGPGTGKTHLSCAILAHAIRAGRTGLFISVAAALRLVRESFGPHSQRTESEALALLIQPDVLVLDEAGTGIGKDEKRQAMLFDILDSRYAAMRSTILIGNLTAEEMQAYLGERVMDRFHEDHSAVLSFRWPSHRRALGTQPPSV
ncbi:ATP-binding protein [Thiorhodovibrio frisius]|uniref:DNA replication protein n=1 Tax=Thiorhodovibrio frisius TaxID=631362 RepID=H8YVK3_9GAMM|nr:ATP-binding protein [Thiorhodovibrio frisius]EIC23943.1 DNA replication protein [Thiorhodovibrio frisius]WPL23017.1 DNA replication protein DnaC [Thiorhodovibrio frisius]